MTFTSLETACVMIIGSLFSGIILKLFFDRKYIDKGRCQECKRDNKLIASRAFSELLEEAEERIISKISNVEKILRAVIMKGNFNDEVKEKLIEEL